MEALWLVSTWLLAIVSVTLGGVGAAVAAAAYFLPDRNLVVGGAATWAVCCGIVISLL